MVVIKTGTDANSYNVPGSTSRIASVLTTTKDVYIEAHGFNGVLTQAKMEHLAYIAEILPPVRTSGSGITVRLLAQTVQVPSKDGNYTYIKHTNKVKLQANKTYMLGFIAPSGASLQVGSSWDGNGTTSNTDIGSVDSNFITSVSVDGFGGAFSNELNIVSGKDSVINISRWSAGWIWGTYISYSLNSAPTIPSSLSARGEFKPGAYLDLISGTSTDAEKDTVFYQYQYTTDGGASWSTIGTITSTTRSFAIPSTITSNFIQFRVRAYDQMLYSGWRNSSEYAIKYNTAPSAPNSVFITNNPTFLTKGVSYTVNAQGATDVDGDALRFNLQYTVDGGTTWVNVNTYTVNYFSFNVPVDVKGSVLQFRVRTYDGQAYSSYKTSANYTLNTVATINVTSPSALLEVGEEETVTLKGNASDSDPNQIVMVYYEVGNSGEQVITSSMSGATFEFTKQLVFKGNSLYDGGTKVASNLVSNGISGEVSFKLYAKDTVGAVSAIKTVTLVMKPNQKPSLSLSAMEFTLKEGDTFDFNFEKLDADEDYTDLYYGVRGFEPSKRELIGNTITLKFYNSSIAENDTKGKTLASGLSTGTYYIDVFAKDEHGAVSETKTVTLHVTSNRKPLLNMNSIPNTVLVTNGEFTFRGTVKDLDVYDKQFLTFGVRENGGEILNIPLNQESGEFEYVYTFNDSDVGMKSLVFIANDQKEITSITQEFEVVDEKILFEFKNPVETDLQAQKVSLLLGHHKTLDATIKVEMCNNAYDANPTWEDVTEEAVNNVPYTFTNTKKTAGKWGINIRVELMKNNAPTVYVDRIGILFE